MMGEQDVYVLGMWSIEARDGLRCPCFCLVGMRL